MDKAVFDLACKEGYISWVDVPENDDYEMGEVDLRDMIVGRGFDGSSKELDIVVEKLIKEAV